MSTQTCAQCAHWRLSTSPLRSAGFGLCAFEEPMFRGARTYSSQAPCCRPMQFAPAQARQIELRKRERPA